MRRGAGAVALLLAPGCGLSLAGEVTAVPDDAAAPALDAQQVTSSDAESGDATSGSDASDSGGADAQGADAADDVSTTESGTVADGWSLTFNGANSYVDCGVVPIPGDFTIEAWVRPSAFNGETYVLAEDERNYSQGQLRFGFVPGGQLFFYMTDAGGNDYGLYSNGQYGLVSSGPVPEGAWSEVAVTKAGADFTLFVGGTRVASFSAAAAFSYGTSGLQIPLRIGSRVAPNGTGADGVFTGLIDEVRLWDVARTQAQIQAAMGSEVVPSDPVWSDLRDYWPFDEGSGTTTADRSGTHPGTLVSGPAWVKLAPF